MQKALYAVVVSTVLAVAVPHPAAAVTTAEKLKKIEQALASEKKDNASYRAAQADAEMLLKKLQAKLIKQTKILQDTETELLAVQDRQTATQQAVTDTRDQLKRQHQKLADLLIAAQRLQRVPPEAMLLRPGEPIDAARTNLLLQRTTPDIAAQANAIKSDLARLDDLTSQLDDQGRQLTALHKKQRKQQAALNGDIKERAQLVALNTAKADKSQAAIKRMDTEAASLRSILADLAKRPPPPVISQKRAPRTTKADASGKTKARSSWGQSVLSFFQTRGPSRLPITGKIRTGYGEKLASGANSQGLSIGGSPGGIVVAPEKGVIRFAGPFRQYRLLVIIEHAGGYHSLLGGLHDVYAKVGSTVSAGEPVGKLESDAAHANLYYEVRRNGKPVDPRGA